MTDAAAASGGGIPDRLAAALADRYRIERKLGEGGMASVYLAHDVRHDRKVAVKVLRPELAAVVGGERFLTEIKTTARLQHPNILPLFDSGEADGFLFYVMPYVQGESLREKIDRENQLPVDESVALARKVAGALQAAHDAGVVHRDIKPANILLDARGEPVVADFGIALAVQESGGGRLTETGLSVGTPFYMSPEQATGETNIGPRSDLYALGCVLYEMLAGTPPFSGGSAQAILGQILSGETSPVTKYRPRVPANVSGAIVRAMEAVPADRFRSASEFVAALDNPSWRYGVAHSRGAAADANWRRMALGAGAMAVLLAAALVVSLSRPTASPVDRRVTRLAIPLAGDQPFQPSVPDGSALSPDGSRFAYVGPGERTGRGIWVRDLDSSLGRSVPGTDFACCLTFSPDGELIAYINDSREELLVTAVDGRERRSLGRPDISFRLSGIHWGRDGYIYAPGRDGLIRIDATSGAVEQLLELDRSNSEILHAYPRLVNEGPWVLFSTYYGTAQPSTVNALNLETGEAHMVVPGDQVQFSMPGFVVFTGGREGSQELQYAPVDLSTMELTSPPVIIASDLAVAFGRNNLHLSDRGMLVYRSAEMAEGGPEELVWVSRDGAWTSAAGGWYEDFQSVALSPDGRFLATGVIAPARDGASRTGAPAANTDLWVRDLTSGVERRLSLEGTVNLRARWTPGGDRLTYISDRAGGDPSVASGALDLFVRDANGGGQPEVLVDLERDVWEGEIPPGGDYVVYRLGTPPTRDLFVRHIHPDSQPRTISASDMAEEVMPSVSPDGRWLAYQSSETGTEDIFVRPFPNIDDAKIQISSGGGISPRWNPAGGELFYRDLSQNLISVAYQVENSDFVVVDRTALFNTEEYQRGEEFCCHPMYDVAPDGSRFLFVRRRGGAGFFTVIQNVDLLVDSKAR